MSQVRRTWEEFDHSVEVYRVSNGAHVEHPERNFMSFQVAFTFFHVRIRYRFENTVHINTRSWATAVIYNRVPALLSTTVAR